jgi:hypothetical protein
MVAANKAALVSLCLVALASLSCARQAPPQSETKSHDGRGGSACPGWAKAPDVKLCSPTLARLAARAEDYDARTLKISGYLMRSQRAAYLCPAPEMCPDGDWSNAVQVRSERIDALTEGSRVTVIGTFAGTSRGIEGQVAGVIRKVDVAYAEIGAHPPSRTYPERAQCSRGNNGRDRPCQTSIYHLLSQPRQFDGLFVEAIAYYPGMDAKLVFVNKDAAEFEDYAASLLLLDPDPAKWDRAAGYVGFVGRFKANTQDHGVGNGVHRQFGTLSGIVRVAGRSPMSERAAGCAKERGCVVFYRDGYRPQE